MTGTSGICNEGILFATVVAAAVAVSVAVAVAVAVAALADILGMKLKFRCDTKQAGDLK